MKRSFGLVVVAGLVVLGFGIPASAGGTSVSGYVGHPVKASVAGGGGGSSTSPTAAMRRYLSNHRPSGDRAAFAAVKASITAHATASSPAAARRAIGLASIVRGWDGQYDLDWTPPQASGAVGPSSYVEVVSAKSAIYTRTGGLTTSATLNVLASAGSDCVWQPKVIYDPTLQVFFYAAVGWGNFYGPDLGCGVQSANKLYFGWSKTSNPTKLSSSWCHFSSTIYGTNLPDAITLGDTQSFLVMGLNEWDSTGENLVGSDVMAWPKPTTPGTCAAPSGTRFAGIDDPGYNSSLIPESPVPVVQTDPSDTGYVLSADFDGAMGTCGAFGDGTCGTHLAAFTVGNSSGTPTLSAGSTVPVTQFDVPPDAPQKGSGYALSTLDARLTQAMSGVDPTVGGSSAPGEIWTQQTVAGGAGAMVAWYEISPGSLALDQSGTVSGSATYVFNASISSDRNVASTGSPQFGDAMVLGFNTSSSTAVTAIKMLSKIGSGSASKWTTVKSSGGPDYDWGCLTSPKECFWYGAAASPDPHSSTKAHGQVWLANQWNVKTTNSNVDARTRVWTASP